MLIQTKKLTIQERRMTFHTFRLELGLIGEERGEASQRRL